MVCIGDKVRIIREGAIYTTYKIFVAKYVESFNSEHPRSVYDAYQECVYPTADEMAHNFTVEYVAPHDVFGYPVAVIRSESTRRVFIYTADALSTVTPVSSHKVGQKIRIKNNEHVYADWDTLIKSQKGIIAPELCDKWTQGKTPSDREEGKLLWIGRHISRPQEDIVCVVETSTGVFIIGEEGLEFLNDTVGEVTWAKYLAYVRNWCTKHKGFAPCSNARPLSLPEWEEEYKAHTLTI